MRTGFGSKGPDTAGTVADEAWWAVPERAGTPRPAYAGAVPVGIPREQNNHEHRVAATPTGLVRRGHDVLVEADEGTGPSIPDAEFVAAGARIAATTDDVLSLADKGFRQGVQDGRALDHSSPADR
jgi:hypothetical protein